jgi:4-amino-4-deoxy-L-arabinose transferase-like glycosyltransferase
MPILQRVAAYPLTSVFCVALAIRLANVVLLPGREAFFGEADSRMYWELGRALANPATLLSTLQSMTDRMPLYPLLLAAIQAAFGDAPRIVALVQAGIDAGTCALIAAIGVLLSPAIGLVAGLLAALSPNLIIYSSQVLTDTTFTFFVALMLLSGARFMLNPTAGMALLAGFAGGLSLATRPVAALMLLAAVPLVFIVAVAQRRTPSFAIAATVVFAIGCALPIAPVMLRNAALYSTLSLTSQTGDHLAYWIVPLVTERADGTSYQTSVDRMQARVQQRLAERKISEASPFRASAIKSEIAWEELSRLPVKAHLRAWSEGALVNLATPAVLLDPRVRALPKPSFYNTPGQSLWEKSRAYLFERPGLYQVVLALGLVTLAPFVVLELIGLIMLSRIQPLAALLAASIIGYFLVINGPVASPKYRLPFEPILIVLSAIPLTRWIESRSSAR